MELLRRNSKEINRWKLDDSAYIYKYPLVLLTPPTPQPKNPHSYGLLSNDYVRASVRPLTGRRMDKSVERILIGEALTTRRDVVDSMGFACIDRDSRKRTLLDR